MAGPLPPAANQAPASDHARVVRLINATLEGPVVEALAELVPEVRGLPRERALESILDDPRLLERCFQAFRANTERFRHLLVDRHKVPVEQADAVLACGRSLEEVVAMIVRTCAKRHFRRRLDGSTKPLSARRRPGRAARPGLVDRLLRLLSGEPPARRSPGRGDRLYDAFKDHLLHDWQVALVPEYSTLSPKLVRRLGPRILDYRAAEDIRRLKESPDLPPPPAKALPPAAPLPVKPAAPSPVKPAEPAVATGFEDTAADDGPAPPAQATVRDERARVDDILSGDGRRLRSGAFTIVLLDPGVRAALPHADQTVKIASVLGLVGGLPAKMLVGELGLRKDQLAVLLLALHDALGERNFERVFGLPGNAEYVAKLIARAKACRLDQAAPLSELTAFVASTFRKA